MPICEGKERFIATTYVGQLELLWKRPIIEFIDEGTNLLDAETFRHTSIHADLISNISFEQEHGDYIISITSVGDKWKFPEHSKLKDYDTTIELYYKLIEWWRAAQIGI